MYDVISARTVPQLKINVRESGGIAKGGVFKTVEWQRTSIWPFSRPVRLLHQAVELPDLSPPQRPRRGKSVHSRFSSVLNPT
jgi:hypothetical protein